MKVLVSCDHVFDILTRGPFPTGQSSDEAVEQHLRACHDCRQLAEALRPAVELLHEAVARDESLALPEYQGSLPVASRRRSVRVADETRPLSLGMRKVHPRQPRGTKKSHINYARLTGAIRLLAASILIGALMTLAWGLVTTPHDSRPMAGPRPLLDQQGLITLASLKLPPTCFPEKLNATTPTERRWAALEQAVACCTGCHAAGKTHGLAGADIAVLEKSCVACHRS